MTMITANCPAAANTTAQPRVSLLAGLNNAIALWHQRRALKSLDAAALFDIGLTRAQAETEAKRPIWDAPLNWKG